MTSNSELPTPGESTYCARQTSNTSAATLPPSRASRASSGFASATVTERPGRSSARQRAAISGPDSSAISTFSPSDTASRTWSFARSRATPSGSEGSSAKGSPGRRRTAEISGVTADSSWISAAREWNSSSTKSARSFSASAAVERKTSGSKGMSRSTGISTRRREIRASSRCSRRLSPTLPLISSARASSVGQVAVFRDPLLRGDLAHAGDPGDVVDAVAHEREDVDHLGRRHPEELAHARLVQELLAARVENAHPGSDELEHVLVRGDDDDVEAHHGRLLRERPDDVVRLVAGQLQDRDAVRLQDAADGRELDPQVVGHRRPVGLVVDVFGVAFGPFRPVPGDRDVVGSVLAHHLAEHGDEAVDRVGWPPRGGREPLDGVVRPVDVGHRVHQVELRGGFGHGGRILVAAFRTAGGRRNRAEHPEFAPSGKTR